jgi:hypothetical protein
VVSLVSILFFLNAFSEPIAQFPLNTSPLEHARQCSYSLPARLRSLKIGEKGTAILLLALEIGVPLSWFSSHCERQVSHALVPLATSLTDWLGR